MRNYLLGNDYLVQLSDSEAFCYSIVEALSIGVPVLTTPLPVLEEIGFEDGKTGFILPFDMQEIDIDEIYNANLQFDIKYDNEKTIKLWQQILGNTIPKNDYVYKDEREYIVATDDYDDIMLGRLVRKGEKLYVDPERANLLISVGVCMRSKRNE